MTGAGSVVALSLDARLPPNEPAPCTRIRGAGSLGDAMTRYQYTRDLAKYRHNTRFLLNRYRVWRMDGVR